MKGYPGGLAAYSCQHVPFELFHVTHQCSLISWILINCKQLQACPINNETGMLYASKLTPRSDRSRVHSLSLICCVWKFGLGFIKRILCWEIHVALQICDILRTFSVWKHWWFIELDEHQPPLKVPEDPSRLRRDTLAVGLRDLELGLQAECRSWINPEAIGALVPMTFKRSPSMNPGRDYWDYWVLVGGLEHLDYFSIDWEFHHPNWRTPSFFRGVGQPPTRVSLNSILFLHSCAEWRLAALWKQGWKGVRFRTSHGDWAKSVLVQLNHFF